MRKVMVLTTSRADFGIMRLLINRLYEDKDIDLQLIVTGGHLLAQSGYSFGEVQLENIPVTATVPFELGDASAKDYCCLLSYLTRQFSDLMETLQPEIVVMLGDRFELLSMAQVALMFGVDIAHLHGGEQTLGAIDDAVRHAITKMASVHFVAHEKYKDRILQMGESPERVHYVGALSLEDINESASWTRAVLQQRFKIPANKRLLLVSLHPETRCPEISGVMTKNLVQVLEKFLHYHIIFTCPNIDKGYEVVVKEVDVFCEKHRQQTLRVKSLGRNGYLSVLRNADAIIGNSSSGIIEAPSLGVASVNIGERQKGRLMPETVIQSSSEKDAILKALSQAIVLTKKIKTTPVKNPFYRSDSSLLVMKQLKQLMLNQFPAFVDFKPSKIAFEPMGGTENA